MQLPEIKSSAQAWMRMSRFWDALIVPKLQSSAITVEDVPVIRTLDVMPRPVYKGIDKRGRLFIAIRARVSQRDVYNNAREGTFGVLYYARTAENDAGWGISCPLWSGASFLRQGDSGHADPEALFRLLAGNTLLYELPAGSKIEIKLDV